MTTKRSWRKLTGPRMPPIAKADDLVGELFHLISEESPNEEEQDKLRAGKGKTKDGSSSQREPQLTHIANELEYLIVQHLLEDCAPCCEGCNGRPWGTCPWVSCGKCSEAPTLHCSRCCPLHSFGVLQAVELVEEPRYAYNPYACGAWRTELACVAAGASEVERPGGVEPEAPPAGEQPGNGRTGRTTTPAAEAPDAYNPYACGAWRTELACVAAVASEFERRAAVIEAHTRELELLRRAAAAEGGRRGGAYVVDSWRGPAGNFRGGRSFGPRGLLGAPLGAKEAWRSIDQRPRDPTSQEYVCWEANTHLGCKRDACADAHCDIGEPSTLDYTVRMQLNRRHGHKLEPRLFADEQCDRLNQSLREQEEERKGRSVEEGKARPAAARIEAGETPPGEAEALDASRALEVAEAANGDARLGEARRLLDSPGAQSAAVALTTVTAAAADCAPEAIGAIKAAERAVRDVVVLRLARAQPGDRGAFLETAEEAFGGPLDEERKAVLLLAYHKMARNKPDTFLSNNQLATVRRGRPRAGRRRDAGGAQELGGAPALKAKSS